MAVELGLEVATGNFLLPAECCDSCHEDANEGYELTWYDDDIYVCCAILRLLPPERENLNE